MCAFAAAAPPLAPPKASWLRCLEGKKRFKEKVKYSRTNNSLLSHQITISRVSSSSLLPHHSHLLIIDIRLTHSHLVASTFALSAWLSHRLTKVCEIILGNHVAVVRIHHVGHVVWLTCRVVVVVLSGCSHGRPQAACRKEIGFFTIKGEIVGQSMVHLWARRHVIHRVVFACVIVAIIWHFHWRLLRLFHWLWLRKIQRSIHKAALLSRALTVIIERLRNIPWLWWFSGKGRIGMLEVRKEGHQRRRSQHCRSLRNWRWTFARLRSKMIL